MSKDNNCFDILRYWAALSVMLLHFIRLGWIYITDLSKCYWFEGVNLVVTDLPGVVIFFTISGFLCAKSLEKHDAKVFLVNRFKRIYPLLWMAIIFNIITICVIKNGFTWIDKSFCPWLILQMAGFIYTPSCLKEFASGSVNGALWTIMIQMQFYLVVALLYDFLKRISIKIWILFIIPLCIMMNIISAIYFTDGGMIDQIVQRLIFPYLLWFVLGIFAYIFIDKIQENGVILLAICLCALAVFEIIKASNMREIAHILQIGYYTSWLGGLLASALTILIGTGVPNIIRGVRLKMDITYEMFLFHWIALNVIIYYDIFNKLGTLSVLFMFVVTTIIISVMFNLLKKCIWRN